ncbi:MAG: hypothetical protein JNM17_26600 [Archangium sp.]|nr:hypothetical protein [Archangium sp.]
MGDELVCVDPDSGVLHSTKVTHIKRGHRETVSLAWNGGSLTCTSDHPLYCPDTKEWAPAGDWALKKRTALLRVETTDEKPVRVEIETVSTFAGMHDVFDLTVEHELHNFVANGVLVHNKSPPPQRCPTDGGAVVTEFDTCTCPNGTSSFIQCTATGSTCSSCADAGTSTDAGTDGGTGHIIGADCPRVLLRGPMPQTYDGDTSTLANSITSPRLEWTDAPDDSLEFVAPETGRYAIELTTSVQSMGVSAQDYNTNGSDAFPFTRAACPTTGGMREINGVYNHNQPMSPLQLNAGQAVVLFVSVPYWANLRQGPYTLTVRKVP